MEGRAAEPLHSVQIAPLPKLDTSADADATQRLQQKLADYAAGNAEFRARLRGASFELERLASLSSAEAITTWALMHLDWPFAERLACYASPVAARIAAIERFLEDGTLPAE